MLSSCRDLSWNAIRSIHPEAFATLRALVKLWVPTAQCPLLRDVGTCWDYGLASRTGWPSPGAGHTYVLHTSWDTAAA